MNSPDISCNVFALMMEAINGASSGIQKQQIADTETTRNYGELEMSISNLWYSDQATSWTNSDGTVGGNLQYFTKEINSIVNGGMSSQDKSNAIAAANAAYQTAVQRAQQATGQADSLVQMSNSQVSTDASNVQSVNQLASMLNIMGYIANLLAK